MLSTDKLIIGQYQPGQGFTYRLDPRTKILIIFMVMIWVLAITNLVFYLCLIATLFTWLLSCRLGITRILNNLKPIIWFVTFTILIHFVFSGKNDPVKIFQIGEFSVSATALKLAAIYSARIVIFVLATFVISLTTSPLAISEGIVSLIKPLRWLKVPVYDLGMILFIALRFIPVLTGEFEMIRKAQYIRGISLSGNLFSRIKKSIALILPVFFGAMRRADELSVAIETRGYKSGQPRSSLRPLRFSMVDISTLSLLVMIAIGYIAARNLL
ncbi:MAG: energy-coupling factor transporter transmembrane component T [candidate division Zixibacteria bacterium]